MIGKISILKKELFDQAIKSKEKTESDIIYLLTKNGADVNIQNNEGMTAFDWANKNGHLEVAIARCAGLPRDAP